MCHKEQRKSTMLGFVYKSTSTRGFTYQRATKLPQTFMRAESLHTRTAP